MRIRMRMRMRMRVSMTIKNKKQKQFLQIMKACISIVKSVKNTQVIHFEKN